MASTKRAKNATKEPSVNKLPASCFRMRLDLVIPITMKCVALYTYGTHFFVCDLSSRFIFSAIEPAVYLKAFLGSR